jgi:cellulose synthase/poly-beta-1,6-N-acetylglucosamine synthase-like glycosyltransferase
VVVTLESFAIWILVRMDWAILGYFVLVNSVYLVLLCVAMLEMRRHVLRVRGSLRWKMLGSRVAPRISMLAPAYNEGPTIQESIRSLLMLNYPNLEVVVVNDGSKDTTLEVLKEAFELSSIHPIYRRRIHSKPIRGLYRSRRFPNLLVVDKENGGKADALNAGLNLATGEMVCAIDADTLIESDALLRLVRPFVENPKIVAAGATIRIANGSQVASGRIARTRAPRNALAGIQVVEYLRAFLFGRLGWNRLGGNLIISGAFGLFRRSSMIDAGGYVHDTVGEDMEIALRLRRVGYEENGPNQIAFVPDPVAWTEAPESARVLGRQRDRWHRGLADVLWRHRKLFMNPRYGAMGMVAFPYFVLVELLAPIIEALGLLGLLLGLWVGAVNLPFALLFFLAAYGLGIALSLLTLVLEEMSFRRYDTLVDRAWLVLWACVESLGYRQLTVYWRLRGCWNYLRGSRAWGSMERRGFQTQAPAKAA